MKSQLIGRWVELYRESGVRQWFTDDKWHRDDGDPAFEDMNYDSRGWWEYGKFIKNDR